MKVNVNDTYKFDIRLDQEGIFLGQEVLQIDAVSLSAGNSHMIYHNRSYNLELISENSADKAVVVKVNGHEYVVSIEDQYDQLLKQMGLDGLKRNSVKEIKAPMPGLVLNVLVEGGQEIKKGDSLLVLEAMKMENSIKSPSDGIVSEVLIQKGSKVEKNEILIRFA